MIAEDLQVTEKEGVLLPEWAPAKPPGPRVMAVANMNQAAGIAARHETMLQIIDELGRRPSTRQMQKLLRDRGFFISHVQISKAYKQIDAGSVERLVGAISGVHPEPHLPAARSPLSLITSVNSINKRKAHA